MGGRESWRELKGKETPVWWIWAATFIKHKAHPETRSCTSKGIGVLSPSGRECIWASDIGDNDISDLI